MFLVYTVWACSKGMTSHNALKEEPTNKNYYDDNYSAFHIRDARSPSLYLRHFIVLHISNVLLFFQCIDFDSGCI